MRLKTLHISYDILLELLRYLDTEEAIPGSARVVGVNLGLSNSVQLDIFDNSFPEVPKDGVIEDLNIVTNPDVSKSLISLLRSGKKAIEKAEYEVKKEKLECEERYENE